MYCKQGYFKYYISYQAFSIMIIMYQKQQIASMASLVWTAICIFVIYFQLI